MDHYLLLQLYLHFGLVTAQIRRKKLNYLFLLIPLINVIIPFFVKSFAVVWSADTVAFFVMYAWKVTSYASVFSFFRSSP
jgi:uncharacterized protein involved in cysteine biosynthesis